MTDDIIDFSKKKNKKLNIGVIVQARMTSKRFPGKMVAILRGKPVLEHVLLNVRAIPGINKVILAVPDTPESEPLLEIASKLKIDNFCGDENNVLNRYFEAAKLFNLDIVMRITGDCPFVNPIVCGEILSLLLYRKLDYCSNIFPRRTYPKGCDCEVFTRDTLDAAHMLADRLQPGDWEHVTPWMQRTEGLIRANVTQRIDASELNLCVDYPEDIKRLENTIVSVNSDENQRN